MYDDTPPPLPDEDLPPPLPDDDVPPPAPVGGWRVLSKCHDMRNRTEYEGALDVDERLVADLIASCRKVAEKVEGLPSIAQGSK